MNKTLFIFYLHLFYLPLKLQTNTFNKSLELPKVNLIQQVFFCTPWNYQKIRDFLMFSVGIEKKKQ